jgi:hypothetical protein
MPPPITSVGIKRFKRLPEITLGLQDATVLIGANNSGKSSFLQAIHFAVSIAQSAKLVGEGVTWRFDKFELSFNPSQLIYSPVADVLSLANGGTLQEPAASRVEIEFTSREGNRCVVGLRRGRNRNIAVSIEGRALGQVLMDFEHPFTVYAPGLAGVPKEERYLSPGVVRRIVARGDANLVLRNVLRMLSQETESWDHFIQDMRSLFPGIDVHIQFNDNTDEHIEAYFSFPGGPRLPVDAAGTSILQASQILAYISLFGPKILILDEPDSHLHPNNQRALCDLIHRLAAERGFQAVISTHSRHVLDAMKDRSSVVWLSMGRQIQEPDVTTTSMLLDLGALDSADYFANGALRCVMATEDADKEPLKALLWSNGFREDDTEVSSYSGCSNINAGIVLGRFLGERAQHVHLVVHRDRDYLSGEKIQRLTEQLGTAGVGSFVTRFSDLEGHFLDAEHINHLNPAISVERAEALLDQAIEETGDQSIASIVNQRTLQALDDRRQGGAAVDHGVIAVQAQRDYSGNPRDMCRGKRVIGRLLALLQQELGQNPRIYEPSPFLVCTELQDIAAEIWPAAQE